MEFEKYIEKDKGPVISWIATKLSDMLVSLDMKLMPYTVMWELKDIDYTVAHNQMTLEYEENE